MSAPIDVAGSPIGQNPSYPVQLIVENRPCLVVGAGAVARRKIGGLLASGADVTVVAPIINPEVAALPVRIFERPYQRGEVASYRLAITCTDDPAVNAQVFADGEAAGVWVNSADDPVNCGFTLPAVARQGDLTLTVSTAGTSPAVASWIARELKQTYDYRYGELLAVVAGVRAEVRAHFGTSEVDGWNEALDNDLVDMVANGRHEQASDRLRSTLGLPIPTPEINTSLESL